MKCPTFNFSFFKQCNNHGNTYSSSCNCTIGSIYWYRNYNNSFHVKILLNQVIILTFVPKSHIFQQKCAVFFTFLIMTLLTLC
eukprot:UN04322